MHYTLWAYKSILTTSKFFTHDYEKSIPRMVHWASKEDPPSFDVVKQVFIVNPDYNVIFIFTDGKFHYYFITKISYL